jgi:hypothetical protein
LVSKGDIEFVAAVEVEVEVVCSTTEEVKEKNKIKLVEGAALGRGEFGSGRAVNSGVGGPLNVAGCFAQVRELLLKYLKLITTAYHSPILKTGNHKAL